ncbi:alanine--tRNA ligase [Alkaliphilus oremlandii]|uniref:Alanine--tRNA ligase n=1 Tax=Alkaliphilus oremlandii (strain OhILAs) TaxID=350688 RepID=SYA_ALKOO|nr:alanine--tRNA ligase [Alkaliphilus oremlandii]A8MGI3.1 RecName: Full=Alanine--tRNA ligase; AltName: Full=Alanyl-tRNA synthetase; Short=AlaRS [Alkaliphilus oremlandii OhILAs]ABW19206.1 alanyl-tRNA synthetase [Alkaliphilus oremlandii OhILAs]
MKKLGVNEIRKEFLEFFRSKEHIIHPSAPLVPQKDKSLLLINSGMAPLKPYFAGLEEPPGKRMATCQKCIRTGDIENVGRTARHATFFEMLGNFSFGDYFKKESLTWGWEFVTKNLELPVDKLWATVYVDDDEAFEIWNKQIGLPEERIVRLGKADNFWEIGLGPCGPCSEIYFDRGEDYGCGCEECKPGCECDRYVEFWNHVFTQFDRDEEGNYHPLPNPNIDTGMGLERMACIMQGVDSIFDIDTMQDILNSVCKITSSEYKKDERTDVSIRIITDHVRSISLMIGDGILPSNEGRGYVLRRLLRRAARHGKLLGVNRAFLYELVDRVADNYGETYVELVDNKDYIKRVIKVEEERFMETIDQGMDILNQYIEELVTLKETVLSGVNAFKLYDTYGFPFDLTKEILEEKGLSLDETGFESEMEKQRQRARDARIGADTEGWKEDIFSGLDKEIQTAFKGYTNFEVEGKVLAIVSNDTVVEQCDKGKEATVILDETAFYGEGGGQVGDIGTLYNEAVRLSVLDTKKGPHNQVHHVVRVEEGTIKIGDEVKAKVDMVTRMSTARNHTATHLLHKALRDIVGEHVHQAGSLVTPDRLRFDFTHFEGLTKDQITQIEEKVNQQILMALDVRTFETSIEDAKKIGAQALFGEKYGDVVRVVKVGEYSTELCGGTHVTNSGEIGMFIMLSEAGVAAGVRRIEAITGMEAYKYVQKNQKTIQEIADTLKTQVQNVVERVADLVHETKEKDREINKLKSQLASNSTGDILDKATVVGGINVVVEVLENQEMDDLRKIGDVLKEKIGSGVIVLGSSNQDKVNFVAMATKDAVSKGVHAGNLVKEAAKIAGGGGGGRPDMAQAGGKNPQKIQEALDTVKEILVNQLNQ